MSSQTNSPRIGCFFCLVQKIPAWIFVKPSGPAKNLYALFLFVFQFSRPALTMQTISAIPFVFAVFQSMSESTEPVAQQGRWPIGSKVLTPCL
jgi:hypothetical protein